MSTKSQLSSGGFTKRNINTAAVMLFSLVMSDLIALMLAVVASVSMKALVVDDVAVMSYVRLWPFLFVFPCVYAMVGLYAGVAFNTPEELKRTAFASTVVFLTLAALTTTQRGAERSFTWTLVLAIGLTVLIVPLFRSVVRSLLIFSGRWGFPTVIFGTGIAGYLALETIWLHPETGLNPVFIVDNDPTAPKFRRGLPVLQADEAAAMLSDAKTPLWAVIASEDEHQAFFLNLVEQCRRTFSRVLLIPNIHDSCTLVGSPRILGGMLGLEVERHNLSAGRVFIKRSLDLILTIVGGLFILPVMALIAICIVLDSRGPIFYAQNRIGRAGRHFRAWKFRSMVVNADDILEKYLATDPALRVEWIADHKLRNDPRVTRIGRILRKTSLDELPQLWNVIRGEMSLVGPRPIVQAEVERYGDRYSLYTRTLGGVTGLWQVSGRNNTSYEERVRLDAFYVRNWSVWLDLCILFRTIGAILFRKGAY